MTFLQFVADAIVGGATGYLVDLLRTKIRKAPEAKPLRCLHSDVRRMTLGRTVKFTQAQCTALRSEFCKDGRCTFHCKKTCRCEEELR